MKSNNETKLNEYIKIVIRDDVNTTENDEILGKIE